LDKKILRFLLDKKSPPSLSFRVKTKPIHMFHRSCTLTIAFLPAIVLLYSVIKLIPNIKLSTPIFMLNDTYGMDLVFR